MAKIGLIKRCDHAQQSGKDTLIRELMLPAPVISRPFVITVLIFTGFKRRPSFLAFEALPGKTSSVL